jgi:histone acetyltransferase (RNA polymerase elongator complex component)
MPKTTIHIPVFVPHAGCPHRCAFCDQRAITGHIQQPGAGDVRRIIDAHLATAPATVTHIEVGFFGGSFTAIEPSIQESLLSAVTPYLQTGSVHGIRVSTRPDCLAPAALELLREYGVSCVELGAQSFNDHVLQMACRGHNADDTRRAAQRIRAAGLECVIQLMPGLPGDTAEISLAGAREAALLADAVRLYPTVVFAGTALADRYTQ